MSVATTAHRPESLAEVVFNMVVALLFPLFAGANREEGLVRDAVAEVLRGLRAPDAGALLASGEVVGFALTAIDTLRLSMQDGLSVGLTLRCRATANALHRSSHRARATLRADQERSANPPHAPLDEATLAGVMAAAANARHQVAEAEARLRAPAAAPPAAAPPRAAAPETAPACNAPTPAPSPPRPAEPPASPAPAVASGPATPAPAMTAARAAGFGPAPTPTPTPAPHAAMTAAERRRRAIWASGMATVAQEMADEMACLGPVQQYENALRVAALSTTVQHLLSEEPLQPWTLPPGLGPSRPPQTARYDPRPGDKAPRNPQGSR